MNAISQRLNIPPVTLGYMAICIVLFLVTTNPSTFTLSNSSLASYLWLYPEGMHLPLGVLTGLTFSFLHLNLGHIAMNLFMLWFVGSAIERQYGSTTYALMIVATSYGSALVVSLLGAGAITVGASGVLYGLFGIALGNAFAYGGETRSLLALIVMNLVYTLISPGVSLWGHVGGLVSGLIIGGLIYLVAQARSTQGWGHPTPLSSGQSLRERLTAVPVQSVLRGGTVALAAVEILAFVLV